jgi:hypothetical protein
MPAHSRPKDGVLSHAYVAGIHVVTTCQNLGVDGRDKPGHDCLSSAQAGADCVSFAPVPMGQETPVPPSPQ